MGDVAGGRVRFLGAVPPAELRERVLRPGRVLLVLSTWEFGPLVAWQAMAWGSLVVSSRFVGSGLEGFLRDGGNALTFPVGDVDAAAAAIARLRDPALRARCGIECEAYDDELLSAIDLYISDRKYPVYYKPVSPFDALGKHRRLLFLTHPGQWEHNWADNTRSNARRVLEELEWRL